MTVLLCMTIAATLTELTRYTVSFSELKASYVSSEKDLLPPPLFFLLNLLNWPVAIKTSPLWMANTWVRCSEQTSPAKG